MRKTTVALAVSLALVSNVALAEKIETTSASTEKERKEYSTFTNSVSLPAEVIEEGTINVVAGTVEVGTVGAGAAITGAGSAASGVVELNNQIGAGIHGVFGNTVSEMYNVFGTGLEVIGGVAGDNWVGNLLINTGQIYQNAGEDIHDKTNEVTNNMKDRGENWSDNIQQKSEQTSDNIKQKGKKIADGIRKQDRVVPIMKKEVELLVSAGKFVYDTGKEAVENFDFVLQGAPSDNKLDGIAAQFGISGGSNGLLSFTNEYVNNQQLQQDYNQIANDLPYAKLSDAVYKFAEIDGWKLIDKKDGTDGFAAATYKNQKTGEIVVAFRGTEFSTHSDRKTDFQLALGKNTSQHQQAVQYFESIKSQYGNNITVTGHSLGGSLAQAVALTYGVQGVTFNSAAVPDEILDQFNNNDIANALVRNYILDGEGVNAASSQNGNGNVGMDIRMDTDVDITLNPTDHTHRLTIMIGELESIANYVQWYLTEGYQYQTAKRQNNVRMLNLVNTATTGNTSHFVSAQTNFATNFHDKNYRKTLQENPFYTKGTIPFQAPVDIVLGWNDRPSDLDSHLTGPMGDGSNFHVWFSNRGSLEKAPNVLLYRDDTSHHAGGANRPEQTRINTIQNGQYNFYVHDYSNRGNPNSRALSQSGAVVTVHSAGTQDPRGEGYNVGKQMAYFNVPTDKAGTVWHAFKIDTTRNTISPMEKIHPNTSVITGGRPLSK